MRPIVPARVLWLMLGLAAFGVALARTARAQEQTPQCECARDTDCERRISDATRSFQTGRLEAALQEFNKAYMLCKDPRVLVNSGVVLQSMKRFSEAIGNYQIFINAGIRDAAFRLRASACMKFARQRMICPKQKISILPNNNINKKPPEPAPPIDKKIPAPEDATPTAAKPQDPAASQPVAELPPTPPPAQPTPPPALVTPGLPNGADVGKQPPPAPLPKTVAETPQSQAPTKKPIYKRGWFIGLVSGLGAAVLIGTAVGIAIGARPTGNEVILDPQPKP